MRKFTWRDCIAMCVVVVMSLVACNRAEPYEPEQMNAAVLQPLDDSYTINNLNVLFTCDDFPRYVIVQVDLTFNDGQFVPCISASNGVRFYRRNGSNGNCNDNQTAWFAWTTMANLGGGRCVSNVTIPRTAFTGWTVGSLISADFDIQGQCSGTCAQNQCPRGASFYKACEWEVFCVGSQGSGGGGFEGGPQPVGPVDPNKGRVSAHRFSCPAYDGSGTCVCDSEEIMTEFGEWAFREFWIVP